TARLLLDAESLPRYPTVLRTTPPLLTTNWLPALPKPSTSSSALPQSDPAPVTTATLLLLVGMRPTSPVLACTTPPLLTVNRLAAPLTPTRIESPMRQRALGLTSRTSLDLALGLRPITPWAELVSSALSESTSN